jgi:hypothetical protein
MTPITEQHKQAAAEVADALFTCGLDERKVDRLTQFRGGDNLGSSWSEGAAINHIAAILARWESQEIARLRSELNDLRAGLRSHLKRASRRTATSRP